MNTVSQLRRDCDHSTLEAITEGTAPADLRPAWALQLRSAAAGRLEGGQVETQGDLLGDKPAEKLSDGTAQEYFF